MKDRHSTGPRLYNSCTLMCAKRKREALSGQGIRVPAVGEAAWPWCCVAC